MNEREIEKIKEGIYQQICKNIGTNREGFSIVAYIKESWLTENDIFKAILDYLKSEGWVRKEE